jgi:Fic family protein
VLPIRKSDRWRTQDGHYQYLGTETDVSEQEAEAVILKNAPESEDKAKTVEELIEGYKTADSTAQRVAKRLVDEGRLTRIGEGKRGKPFRYFLPEKVSSQTTYIYEKKESEGGAA